MDALYVVDSIIFYYFVISTSYRVSEYSEYSVVTYQLYWKHIQQLIHNLLKLTAYVMHQQFNIQQLYVLPTLYLCVFYLSENKQRLVPLTA